MSKNHIDIFVGSRIRRRRKDVGITLTQLADLVGITYQQIQKYESAENRVSAPMICKISEAMKINVSFFFPPRYTWETENV